MTETPQATYDTARGPVREAAADAASVRTTLEKSGAEAAVTRLRSEIDSVPERDRSAYNTALLKNLQGDGRTANILPDMAIAFGMQNPGKISDTTWKWARGNEPVVNAERVSDAARTESNPVYQELYRELGNKYRGMKAQDGSSYSLMQPYTQGFRPWETQVPIAQLQDNLKQDRNNADNRSRLGLLAVHPKLFNDIAGGDGAISRDSVLRFQDNWNQSGQAGIDFRKQYGATPEQQRRVADTVDNLRLAFDDDRNKGNKPGSLLKDNVMGIAGTGYGEWASSYGKMTKDSLLQGLGYKTMDEAKLRLPADVGGKPIADVTSLNNYENTKLVKRNEGPEAVARRMLSGQEQFFKDQPGGSAKALADLTTAMGVKAGNHDDRLGANQVKPENRDKILTAIDGTGNTRLRDWFASRYPADMSAVANTSSAPIDNSSSKVVSRQGPDAVAKNMLEGSGLDDKARRDLSRVLYKEIGVDWKSVRAGSPLINPAGNDNLEMVRSKISASGNDKLINWFESKYPKR